MLIKSFISKLQTMLMSFSYLANMSHVSPAYKELCRKRHHLSAQEHSIKRLLSTKRLMNTSELSDEAEQPVKQPSSKKMSAYQQYTMFKMPDQFEEVRPKKILQYKTRKIRQRIMKPFFHQLREFIRVTLTRLVPFLEQLLLAESNNRSAAAPSKVHHHTK